MRSGSHRQESFIGEHAGVICCPTEDVSLRNHSNTTQCVGEKIGTADHREQLRAGDDGNTRARWNWRMRFVAIYLATAVPFLLIDLVWLKTMGERMYRPVLGDMLLPEPRPWPAAVFYLLYPLGLIGFAVMPAYQDESLVRALVLGLLCGFFTYATYDLTNQATLRNWTNLLTITDTAWGAVLAACCACSGYIVADRLWQTS